jgi:hypothetical protein
MLNINFYTTINDDGQEKYILTIDVTVAELQAMTADEIGTEVLDAIAAPPVPLGGV